MTITEHGILDVQKLIEVISEILSDRYKVEIVVSVSTSASALSSEGDAVNSKH